MKKPYRAVAHCPVTASLPRFLMASQAVMSSRVSVLISALVLAGCAVKAPFPTVVSAAPPQWYAALPPTSAPASVETRPDTSTPTRSASSGLPHNGSLTSLSHWWQQQHDPLLVELIDAAQVVSPSVITARANIAQAQAISTAAQAALQPTLDATASLSRNKSAPINQQVIPVSNLAKLGLQTSWELDLFGKNRATLEADQQRLLGTEALWHDARVSVAAEAANRYYSLRACARLTQVAQADAQSRAESARLIALTTQAGFEAPATAALARASAAESRARVTQQGALCELDVKALVALTALDEPTLREKLAQTAGDAPQQGFTGISSVPAEVLEQRPDVFSAAQEVTAASFEVSSADAQRYPRLSIGGAIAGNRVRSRTLNQNFNTWSIGPVAFSVPLFDGGASQANLDAVIARYAEAAGKYRSTVRQAVREVEEALVNLQSIADRGNDTAVAEAGYHASFAGTQARYTAGLASLVELEESRRFLLSAQSAVINLEKERQSAWVALYRALGGGWTSAAPRTKPVVFDMPKAAPPGAP